MPGALPAPGIRDAGPATSDGLREFAIRKNSTSLRPVEARK